MHDRPVVPPAMRAAILAWYDSRGRSLAFRGTLDPYEILVSEAMAQQTQVGRVAEAWSRFVARFPTFAVLAAATPADVLREWRGLGYNRRALALRQTAIAVIDRHRGELPRDVAALERLPGIGPYTARAVAALAFGLPVGAVDTNVRRVLTRAVLNGAVVRATIDVTDEEGSAVTPRALQQLADASVPPDRPAAWTHALMDVGALFCRPRSPLCSACPAQPWCRWASRPASVPAGLPGAPDSPARSGRPGTPSHRLGESQARFVSTRRWLRGRILDRLRDAPDGDWVDLSHAIGVHGPEDVLAALVGLANDGLAERHPTLSRRARLPLS